MWRCPPLLPSQLDTILIANELEAELRVLTVQYRQELGLGTHWDDDLSYLLSPALTAYELERCTGLSVGNEEFQDAIHNAVPLGHTFKGFPIQLTSWNPKRVFSACTKSQVCTDILSCRGDQVRMAVRTKLCDYPEGVCAVWVMFAVKYKSVL